MKNGVFFQVAKNLVYFAINSETIFSYIKTKKKNSFRVQDCYYTIIQMLVKQNKTKNKTQPIVGTDVEC